MVSLELEKTVISDCEDFLPKAIFDCGQAFRWTEDETGAYTGVAYGIPARVWREGDTAYILSQNGAYKSLWHTYFDMDTNYSLLRAEIGKEKALSSACEFGRGIRILRQEPWEALCSFIISQCNNIPRIRGIVEKLSEMCGDEISFCGKRMYSFPNAENVARLSERELGSLRAGYRAAYIKAAAEGVASGEINLSEIMTLPTAKAKEELLSLSGVGEKVASCVLLFGMGKLDAFPVDVWMKRAIVRFFGEGKFDYTRFGNYAGLAQQYMFHYMRNGE